MASHPTGSKPIVKSREKVGRLNSLLKLTFGSLKWKRKSNKEELTTKTTKIGHQKHEHESYQAQTQAIIRSYISFR